MRFPGRLAGGLLWFALAVESTRNLATGFNKLARLYLIHGKTAEAEQTYGQALAIWDQAGPPSSLNAVTLANLAALHHERRQEDRAADLYRRAVSILRETTPHGSAELCSTLNSLAGVEQTLGHYVDAERLYRSALASAPPGRPGPEVALALNNFAQLCLLLGRHAEAEDLCRRGLDIARDQPPAPYSAALANNLAALYRLQGRYTPAAALYAKAVAQC